MNNEKNVILFIRCVYPSIQRLIIPKRSPRGHVHVRVRSGKIQIIILKNHSCTHTISSKSQKINEEASAGQYHSYEKEFIVVSIHVRTCGCVCVWEEGKEKK